MIKKIVKSEPGRLLLIADRGKLIYCNWESPDCEKKLARIINSCKEEDKDRGSRDEEENIEILLACKQQLEEYFMGKRRNFDIPVELHCTPFQRRVLEALEHIPYGEVISYAELAHLLNMPKSCRAIANACGSNPISIILPCHRVIRKGGDMGGYTGGKEKKRYLLKLEKSRLTTV